MTLSSLPSACLPKRVKERIKAGAELRYWRHRQDKESVLGNSHYEYFYTSLFGLQSSDYDGKSVLDVGCGPRGSLEWASGARERVGLDPLVNSYRGLGIDQVEHEAALTEPHRLEADSCKRLFAGMELMSEARYRMDDTYGIYDQIKRDDRVDSSMLGEAHILVAKFRKN